MTRVDAHHHLWDPGRRHYPFLDGTDLAPVRKRYGLGQLRATMIQLGVARTVLVQTLSDPAETGEFLSIAAASDGLIAGVVGWADLTAPDLEERLVAMQDSPGGHLLVGIRHQIQDEPDPGWADRDEVVRGVRTVGAAGLVYDLLLREPQWKAGCRLVESCPDTSFVLDHAGKPPIASGDLGPWRSWITDLADRPNVAVKVSGLVTEADWQRWTSDDLKPVIDTLVEAFGPQRMLQGSDWPLADLAGSTSRSWQTVTQLLEQADAHAALGDTAAGVYRLGETA
ncbi:amidohydrolase family protein [Flexivirga meconopsidis]|uniref:amidohydrolase family protein n=1 Tax=Flexivirga meconopsidis TaxID=2977121 RepID=UPI002240B996|nr:amidohydrolase family protein [Flexivirga meconopsidis]